MANTINTIAPDALLRSIIDGTIENFEDDTITTAKEYMFASSSLASVKMPNQTQIKGSMFRNTKLETIYLPKASTTGQYGAQYAFRGLQDLTIAVLPGVKEVCENFLDNDPKLRIIDFTDVTKIWRRSLTNNELLDTIIIRNNTVPTLLEAAAIGGGFRSSGTGGTLYVPQNLITQYEQASNWSTLLGYTNNQIAAIEGSNYEHYYADGTPIPAAS